MRAEESWVFGGRGGVRMMDEWGAGRGMYGSFVMGLIRMGMLDWK
jgi:hypothetical protein